METNKATLQRILDLIFQLLRLAIICGAVAFITFNITSEYTVKKYSSEEFAINYRHEQMMLKDWEYCPYCGKVLEEE